MFDSANNLSTFIQTLDTQVHIVAHSVGGLVGRGAAIKIPEKIITLTTIVTPFNGHRGAVAGVYLNLRPFIRPSWRDLVPGSTYQRSISMASTVRHYVITADDGSGSDGTVSLNNQQKRKIVNQAIEVRQYNETHTGILHNTEVISDWLLQMENNSR